MNSAIVGVLRALLTANTAEFDTALKRSADSARIFSRDLKSIGFQATQTGASLTKTLTLPIVGAVGAIASAAISFESSFAGVRKTVQATETQFAALSQGMRDLAKTMPVNVNELNRIGEAAGQLGIKTENILGFTKVMAELGVTTNLSSDQAASALARLANITKMPQDQFDRLGSTVVDLGNKSAATESEIVDFGLRIAGAGKIAGLTEANILAIGAAMASVGVEAEAGGTAVQKVLIGMTQAVAEGNAQLGTFAATAGMSASQFATAFRTDAAGAFQAFVEGLGKQGDDAFQTLEKLDLQDQRLIRSFLSLAGAGDQLARRIADGNQAWRENTALTEEAGKRAATTESKLTMLWTRIKDVGITLGTALLPMINASVSAFERFIPVIDFVSRVFVALPPPVQAVGLGLLALVAAAGPALYIFGQLALSASSLTVLFTKKGLATRLLSTDLGLLRGAYVVLTTPITLAGTATAAGATAMGVKTLAARTLTGTLGLLTGAVRGLWLAMLAHPLVAIVAGLGAVTLAATKWIEASKQAQLTAQESAAKQDTINAAIKRGAEATIDYAEAVKFNDEWVKRHIPTIEQWKAALQDVTSALNAEELSKNVQLLAQNAALTTADMIRAGESALLFKQRGQELSPVLENIIAALPRLKAAANAAAETDLGGKMGTLSAQLKAADAEIARLSKTARDQLAAALRSGAFEMKDLQAASGLSEVALKRFKDQLEKTEKSTKTLGKETKELAQDYRELQNEIGVRQMEDEGARMKAIVDRAAAERQMMNDIGVGRMEAEAAELARIKTEEAAWRQYLNWLGERRMEDERAAMDRAKRMMSFFDQLKMDPFTTIRKGLSLFTDILKDIQTDFAQTAVVIVRSVDIISASLKKGEDGTRNWGRAIGAGATALASLTKGSTVAGAAARGAAMGAIAGPWGAAIGAAAGAIWGAFSKAEEKAVNRTRESFVQLHGGLYKLAEHARVAGTNLDAMLKAKTVKEYEAAIKDLQGALDFQKGAMDKLDEAVQRYGFDLASLGPTFAGTKLGEQAQQFLQDFALLSAAGVDHNEILSHMAPTMKTYIDQARAAGVAVPLELKSIIDEMIRLGQITKEDGTKFESTEEAGITFATSLNTIIQDELIPTIKALTEAIVRGLGGAIDETTGKIKAIPRKVDIDVNFWEHRRQVIGAAREEAEAEMHAGGIVPRYHRGGAVGALAPIMPTLWPRAHTGLRPDERPIIAQVGEGIFSVSDVARLGGASGFEALRRGLRQGLTPTFGPTGSLLPFMPDQLERSTSAQRLGEHVSRGGVERGGDTITIAPVFHITAWDGESVREMVTKPGGISDILVDDFIYDKRGRGTKVKRVMVTPHAG